MDVNGNKCYVNYNDRDNPVPGSAADVAKRAREAKALKVLEENKKELDEACDTFPAFARLLDSVMNKR